MDNAFATKKRNKDGNVVEQSISQSQSSVQNALYASGGTIFLSCNNVSLQNQKNSGATHLYNNVKMMITVETLQNKPSINQSQPSSQNSQVVSGRDTIGPGKNINVQNQENSGSNAAAQR